MFSLRKSASKNAFISYDKEVLEFISKRISSFALVRLKDNYLLDIIEKPPLKTIATYKDATGKLRVSMNAFKFDGKMFYSYLKCCPVHPDRNENLFKKELS